jgi:hypothetical protein
MARDGFDSRTGTLGLFNESEVQHVLNRTVRVQ